MFDIDEAAQSNWRFVAGQTVELSLKLQDEQQSDMDLTGYTAEMQVRTNYSATSPLISVSTTSSAAGVITVNAKGELNITIAKTATAIAAGAYVYDLKLTSPSGTSKYILRGQFVLEPRVTP
jgi:hypothetical protein